MPLTPQFLVEQLLLPALLTFLQVGGVVGLVFGLALFARSALTLRLTAALNRWVSFRRILKPVEQPRDSWQTVQRNRRWLTLALATGAAFTLYSLLTLPRAGLVNAIVQRFHLPPAYVDWLVGSAITFLVIGNVVAIVCAGLLGFAPAVLARLEQQSAHWYSSRNAMRTLSEPRFTFDRLAARSPRLTGALIALFSLVEIASLWRFMH